MSDEYSTIDFLSDLQREDELGAVIRAHIFIEHYVDAIIELLVPYPENLKPLNLDFDGKLSLITALGVKPEVKKPLSVLGKLRNKFAHRPNYKLDESEVNNLYKSLRSKDRERLNQDYLNIIKSKPDYSHLPSFKELLPKEKFAFIAIYIRAIIMTTRDKVKSRIA